MKKWFCIFVYCLLPTAYCFGQTSKIDSLQTILKISKEDTTKINTLNKLFLEVEFSDDKKATKYLDEALELSQKINYKKGLSITYIYLGYFAEDKGNYSEALKNYTTSLKASEDIGFKKGEADSYNNIGSVYNYQGNYPDALKNYFISLKIREGINDKKGIADSFNNIGIVYNYQGNYSEALKNIWAALEKREEIGNKKGIADSYNNIGSIFDHQSKYPEALKNYLVSLKIRKAINDKKGIGSCYNKIAGIYSDQGNYPEALKSDFASLKIKEDIDDEDGIAESYLNIGAVFFKQNKYNVAEEYFEKGKKLSEKIGSKAYLKDVHKALTELDSAKGDFKGAYENHKLFILYCDSLDNEETRKKTIQSQMTYDFEKKEAVATAEHKKELENHQTLAEEKSRKQKIVLFFVSCFLFLVLLFAGFIFRSLRVTRKQKDIIQEQKNIVEQQKQEVEHQKLLVEEHQKEIIDSIYYARRIQRSLLPTEKYIEKNINRLKKVI